MPDLDANADNSAEHFEQVVEFGAAHDCMRVQPCKFGSDRCKPGSGGSHGIGAVDMRMVLKGPLGVVQFVLYTGWHLDETPEGVGKPLAADLGYHSPTPLYEGQYQTESCTYFDGASCFYDGSSLNAEEPWRILRYEGGDAVWKYLRDYYASTFEQVRV